jgi:two-component system cell cycle sensor histidine kinase/response regulator CckA
VSNGEKRLVVLVVDDEPFVLNSVSAVLELAGYCVQKAASGEEALCFAAQYSGPIDLLLTDVRLPGLSGPRVAAEFAALHPESRCLFMAGLPEHPELPERVRRDRYALLAKPFTPRILLENVQHALQPATQTA